MRVLVVDEEIPYPLNSGKRIRTFNLLKHLSSRHEIVYVCRQHADAGQPDIKALEAIGIEPIIVPHEILGKSGAKFYLALGANLLSKYPYSVASHRSERMIAAVKALTAKKRFDLIHCEWTPYLANLAPIHALPVVCVAHNVESMIWRRNFEVEQQPVKKAYIYLQWRKMERFEQTALRSVSMIVAVSSPDKECLSQWVAPERVAVVENGVDTEYFAPSTVPSVPCSLVFTGALDWRPNVDCMLYFLKEIWPLVLASCPAASLTIVGRKPMDILTEAVKDARGVTLEASVPDVRPYLEKAEVYIVPLRIGGGSRLKILEALAMGKAVVSTAVGAEGLRTQHERELLIADSPEDFVAAIARLFADMPLRHQLGTTGRRLVEKHYRWATLAGVLEESWASTLDHGGRKP